MNKEREYHALPGTTGCNRTYGGYECCKRCLHSGTEENMKGAGGYCIKCGEEHFLPRDPALAACEELMARLERRRHLMMFSPSSPPDPSLGTDYLFGEARGKMFGALVGTDVQGREVTLHAFSGQYNGRWEVPGWVGPVFSTDAFDRLNRPAEKRIKEVGARMDRLPPDDSKYVELKRVRKELSRKLMEKIFDLYRFRNFRGETAPLIDIYGRPGMPPTGTGDCCAPKLLHHAAMSRIRPGGMAEFYWGLENVSRTRRHGRFYPPCTSKCEPILGFLLCGIAS